MRFAELSARDAVALWGRITELSFERDIVMARYFLAHDIDISGEYDVRRMPFFPGVRLVISGQCPRYFYALPHLWPELRGSAAPHISFLARLAAELGIEVEVGEFPPELLKQGWSKEERQGWFTIVSHLTDISHGLLAGRSPTHELEPRVVASFIAEASGLPVTYTNWFSDALRECSKEDLGVSKKRIMEAVRKAAKICHALA